MGKRSERIPSRLHTQPGPGGSWIPGPWNPDLAEIRTGSPKDGAAQAPQGREGDLAYVCSREVFRVSVETGRLEIRGWRMRPNQLHSESPDLANLI